MISPGWRIRDARFEDMSLIRTLFAEEGMGDLTDPSGIRIAIRDDATMLGALRIECGSDGIHYVRPIVVFESERGHGIGSALIRDALKKHPDLRLVSRGSALPFYVANDFEICSWGDIAPEYVQECELCPGKGECRPQAFRAKEPHHTLVFLGTSSGCGVPAFFCHCPSCEAARKDPALRRGCTGVIVRGHSTTLIDAPPDLRHQLNREGISDLDEFFLTHAHFDHLGGLGELEYLVRLYRDEPLPFHASAYAMKETFKEFSYMDDCFVCDEIAPFEERSVDGMTVQALPVVHAPGTYGYLLTTPNGHRTFYAPDTGALEDDVAAIIRGVDTLIWDATFWEDGGDFRNHHSVKQAVEDGIALDAGKIYLTHLAPHICKPDVNAIDRITEYASTFGGRVIVACDGMEVTL